MKALIEHIAKSLVDRPDDVSVQEMEGEQTTILELRVANEDLGKVIGKAGKMAQAMRVIVAAAAVRAGKRCVLEIIDK